MRLKKGAIIANLKSCMRPVMIAADAIYKAQGVSGGVMITSGLDGCHSAGSWHPYGRALDFRTHDIPDPYRARDDLAKKLGKKYRVFYESAGTPNAHIHVDCPE